ncbi:MauE/DoxX family redox-associated membrane protein [Actinomadura viridis]|uniref:MauE/DoxX family redox-associated membrane protein n=1 Tax=Actinomadura viridis TaxID=58110 RepID=UPI0036BB8618
MSNVVLTLRVLVGGVFLVAVASKAHGPASFARFADSVRQVAAVPRGAAAPVAAGVLLAEAAVVLLLAVPGPVPSGPLAEGLLTTGFLLAAVMLAGFSVVLATALRRGVTSSCQCFGASGDGIGRRHVARNGALLLCSVTGAALTPAAAAVTPFAAVLCVAAAAAAVAATVLLDDLLYLFR